MGNRRSTSPMALFPLPAMRISTKPFYATNPIQSVSLVFRIEPRHMGRRNALPYARAATAMELRSTGFRAVLLPGNALQQNHLELLWSTLYGGATRSPDPLHHHWLELRPFPDRKSVV